jgi:hypothetical protein
MGAYPTPKGLLTVLGNCSGWPGFTLKTFRCDVSEQRLLRFENGLAGPVSKAYGPEDATRLQAEMGLSDDVLSQLIF